MAHEEHQDPQKRTSFRAQNGHLNDPIRRDYEMTSHTKHLSLSCCMRAFTLLFRLATLAANIASKSSMNLFIESRLC